MKTTTPPALLALAFLAAPAPALAAEAVPVPAFRSLELRGGGNVLVRPGPVQRVTIVSGSSGVTRIRVERDGQLRIDACNARCPRLYRLVVEVESPSLPDVAVSGGGRIAAASGFRPQRRISAAVHGGGEIAVVTGFQGIEPIESSDQFHLKRFKERLKELRAEVHVLTLSATPIRWTSATSPTVSRIA